MTAAALPAEIGTALPLPNGEVLLVQAEVAAAIDDAIVASRNVTGTFAAWRTAFGDALVGALHARGLILVARGHQQSRETVNANLYSLARDAQHAAERQLGAVARLIGPQTEAADLVSEFAGVIAALTGHAPLNGAGRLAHVDERLRLIHQAALGRPAPIPAQAGAEGETQ